MAATKKRKRKRVLVLLIALVLILFYFGPSLIHSIYRAGTPESERETNRSRYHELASKEVGNKPVMISERGQISEEKKKLLYWFHARGWAIDEGSHESALEERKRHWRELFKYWALKTNPRRAGF